MNKATRYAYNTQGQVTRTWGDAAYPVAYDYDAYGRMIEMKTFRSGSGFTDDTWPDGNDADSTKWHYQETTGLLLEKEDDAGKNSCTPMEQAAGSPPALGPEKMALIR